jgi:hypothetical protein
MSHISINRTHRDFEPAETAPTVAQFNKMRTFETLTSELNDL